MPSVRAALLSCVLALSVSAPAIALDNLPAGIGGKQFGNGWQFADDIGMTLYTFDRDEGARGCEHAGGGAEGGELLGGGGGHGVTCRFAHPAGPAAPYTLLGRLLCKLPQGKYCETENEFFGAV